MSIRRVTSLLSGVVRRIENCEPRSFAVTILLLAVAVRILWIATLPNEQVSDSVQYQRLATNVAQGEGFVLNGRPNTFWPAGYPLFLAVFFRACGLAPLAGKLANVVLSLGIVWLTHGIGRSLFNEATGRWGAIMVALLPSQIADCSLLRTEILSLVLLLLAFYFLVKDAPQVSIPSAIVVGLLLGMASLVRPSIELFPIAAVAVLMIGGTPWKRTLLAACVILFAQCATIAPWTVRNYNVLKSFVPIATNGGYNLWIGNNPHATGTYLLDIDGKMVHSFQVRQQLLKGKNWNEAEADAYFHGEAAEFIKQEPVRFVSAGLRKLWYFYALDTDAVNWTLDGVQEGVGAWPAVQLMLKLNAQGCYMLVMLLAGAGVWSMLRDGASCDRKKCLVLVPVFYFTAVHAVFVGDDRYHFPVMPFLCIVAASWLVCQLGRNEPCQRQADQTSG